jgi:hypothetical protein
VDRSSVCYCNDVDLWGRSGLNEIDGHVELDVKKLFLPFLSYDCA